MFPLLGITPVLGRSFRDGDDRPGAAKVVMIAEALWQRRFGGDPSIIGRSPTLNGMSTIGACPRACPQA
jgi:putative ABC transport system permease protein